MPEKTSTKPFSVLMHFFIGSALVIALDQFVKYKIRQSGGFYLCNSGISFGIPVFGIFFWLILGMFLLSGGFFCVYLYKKGLFSPTLIFGLVLFMGGATSNLIDRFLWGCVLDYIYFLSVLFPVFNLADLTIFSGGCLILYDLLHKGPINSK